MGTVSIVESLGVAAAVHAASLSAAAFKLGDKLSCCATPTDIIPLRKIKTNKVTDFMGPEDTSLYIGLLREDTTRRRAKPLFKQVRGIGTRRNLRSRQP